MLDFPAVAELHHMTSRIEQVSGFLSLLSLKCADRLENRTRDARGKWAGSREFHLLPKYKLQKDPREWKPLAGVTVTVNTGKRFPKSADLRKTNGPRAIYVVSKNHAVVLNSDTSYNRFRGLTVDNWPLEPGCNSEDWKQERFRETGKEWSRGAHAHSSKSRLVVE